MFQTSIINFLTEILEDKIRRMHGKFRQVEEGKTFYTLSFLKESFQSVFNYASLVLVAVERMTMDCLLTPFPSKHRFNY